MRGKIFYGFLCWETPNRRQSTEKEKNNSLKINTSVMEVCLCPPTRFTPRHIQGEGVIKI
jgi:hypothetical protein